MVEGRYCYVSPKGETVLSKLPDFVAVRSDANGPKATSTAPFCCDAQSGPLINVVGYGGQREGDHEAARVHLGFRAPPNIARISGVGRE
jgi:hypothetical protein